MPGPRKKRPRGFSRRVRHEDRAGHGAILREQAVSVVAGHRQRLPILGIAPELVLVIEGNGKLGDKVRPAGLSVLEYSDDKILVAFASDPELKEFLRRNAEYRKGPRTAPIDGRERAAEFEELFDLIERVRPLSIDDVLSPELWRILDRLEPAALLRLDIQCWCPDDRAEAERRHQEVARAVTTAGGVVLDRSLRHFAGLSLLRVELAAGRVRELATTDRIRSIDNLPRPVLTQPQVWGTGPADLPPVMSPPSGAPKVAVIDSGVRSAHPLLAPAVVAVNAVGGILPDGGDGNGHGTLVASLALYGQLEEKLAAREPLRPAGQLLSVRVLDDQGNFLDARLWEEHLLEALFLAADAGARVINLSLGDLRRPYRPPRPTPLGAVIDRFARERNVVVVISAGNCSPGWYTFSPDLRATYLQLLVNADDSGLLDPASASLALTCGALCADNNQGVLSRRESIDLVPLGGPDLPSPATRVGPGVGGAIKPELVAPGGGYCVDESLRRVTPHMGAAVVGAAAAPDRLLAFDAGTSFAAPLVSHAALRVLSRYPQLSANAVRALLLASAQESAPAVSGATASEGARRQAQLTGYGRVSADRAEASDDHRAVLVAEHKIDLDGVHLYVVPVPSTFFQSGGHRTLTVSLAYDPEVRPTRLDHLSSRMMFRVYRGASLQVVADAYAELSQAADDLLAEEEDVGPPQLQRHLLDKLQPADARRGAGANQFARQVFKQKLRQGEERKLIVVVRNTNRWGEPGSRQPYALTVVLERDPARAPLYDELRAELALLAEVEVEVG